MGILLKNGTIITQNISREIFQADILIENSRIIEIGTNLVEGSHTLYPCDNLVISPGFVQSHVHLCQTLFRNLSDDLELLDWLEKSIWPLEMAHDEVSLRTSTQLGLAEMMLSGTTCILDMGIGSHQEIIFQEMERSGIRGFSGMVMMDAGDQSYQQTTDEISDKTLQLIESWHQRAGGRIRYALAPRFVPSCSPDLWRLVKQLSEKHQLIIHTHASENKTEWQLVKDKTGYSNIEFFVKNNLASSRLCLAHCIWISEPEMQMLSDYQINVLHCPSANLKLGSGIAPIPAMREKGITVGLGSDGASCNNNLDIFNEMRLAALIQKPVAGVQALSAAAVFEMATVGGARAVGLEEEIGSLEMGKKADLVILDLNKVHSIPADDIYSQIVYSGKSSNVLHVMIDGKWVVFNQKLLAYPVTELIKNTWDHVHQILERQQ